MSIQEIIVEALETRKFQPGQVKFSKSDWNDPHIQKILAAVATAAGVPAADIIAEVNNKLAEFAPMVQKAPILYKTIKDNLIEGELFNKLADDLPNPIESGAPVFKERTFFKLVRSIAAEHDEFWPLRSYIDGRRLQPKFEFVTLPMSDKNGVTTAAATPNGEFIFNTIFMQKLLDYAALKEIKPKGKKYVGNGGDIPDGYAYIEFLILHEFMHYTNDDFHYQKVIPNANNKIINWVGDFRSNYLLVKSGYEQLPMGLFNDDINYDRQKTYIEMYDLVKKEMEAMRDPEMEELMKKIQEHLDKQGDDHEPGQEQGKGQPASGKPGEPGEGSGPGGEMTPEDIDKAGKATAGKMEEGEDLTPEERAEKEGKAAGKGEPGGPPDKGGSNNAADLDYKNIRPTFNWKGILNRLISKAIVRNEESYSKPSRRSVSSMDIARQVGAAAIKPAEKPEDFAELKIAFVIDSSGSMSNVIGKVMSNATNLLGTPKFKNAEAMVIKFSSTYDIFRVNFYANKATKVPDVTTVPKVYNLKTNDVFGVHFAAGTDFSTALAGDISTLGSKKWNVLFFLDGDILQGDNFKNFMTVLKAHPANTFVIFDTVQTYQNFRKKAGMSTPNITYFQ